MSLSPSALEQLPFELSSLAQARNYQKWVYETVRPHFGQRILEIGAGIGNMSQWLPANQRLVLTETDPVLFKFLQETVAGRSDRERVRTGQLNVQTDDLGSYIEENLDTIVSFNVLEHIEQDRLALQRLCEILTRSRAPGPKRLISFVPSHGWAYGEMDKAFGHFRRYSRSSLGALMREVAPEAKTRLRYFNAIGLMGWVVNGRLLGKTTIGSGSISTFEALCPWIRDADDFAHETLRLPFGQSLLSITVWNPGTPDLRDAISSH